MRITFIDSYSTGNGDAWKRNQTAEVPDDVGRQLLRSKVARTASAEEAAALAAEQARAAELAKANAAAAESPSKG